MPRDIAHPLRHPRDHRAHRRRLGTARVQARYGKTLVTASPTSTAIPVGIVANNGILFSRERAKGAHFIELCNQRDIPLLFLQNITGFMVGKKYENGGIAKDGAKMVHRRSPPFAGAQVHRDHRRQLGAGNYGMCGRAPSAALPVDVAQRAHLGDGRRAGRGVLATVRRKTELRPRARPETAEEEACAHPRAVRDQGHPTTPGARLWDDGVIDPVDTCRVGPGPVGQPERTDRETALRRVSHVAVLAPSASWRGATAAAAAAGHPTRRSHRSDASARRRQPRRSRRVERRSASQILARRNEGRRLVPPQLQGAAQHEQGDQRVLECVRASVPSQRANW